MDIREFLRFHLLKTLLIFVVIQIAVLAVIQNFNHRPQTLPDQVSTIEGRSVKINPVFNDFDKDEGDELSLEEFSTPLHGSLEQDRNRLNYTPVEGFVGTDSIIYAVSDGRKKSKTASITIDVKENLKPVANRDIAKAYSGGEAKIEALRNDTDNEGDSIFISSYSQPQHGRLVKVENEFVYSANTSSAQIDSFYYAISDGKSISDSVSVIIHIIGKNHSCYPWLSSDVGDAAMPGSFSCANKTIFVEASGSDIWNDVDGFHFAYQYIKGNCEIYAKVESIEGEHEWAKAGLMVRESLKGDSRCAFLAVSKSNGAISQYRVKAGEIMEAGNRNTEIKAPYWLKLSRTNDTFNLLISPDGNKWEKLESFDVPMDENVYVGFVLTSHNNSEIGKAIFSNYNLTGKAAKF